MRANPGDVVESDSIRFVLRGGEIWKGQLERYFGVGVEILCDGVARVLG